MSYDEIESNPGRAGVVTLYEFSIGSTGSDVFRLTDADEPVFHELARWDVAAIQRGEIENPGSLTKANLDITVPRTFEVAAMFAHNAPSDVITVRVLEGHFADRDREFAVVFLGRLLNVKMVEGSATLSCVPASTAIKRPGNRRYWQRVCGLALYGSKCRAQRVDHECAVQAFDDNTILIAPPPGGFLPGVEAYANGTIQWSDAVTGRNTVRSVLQLEQEADTEFFRARVSGPVQNVPDIARITKGCAHSEEACLTWHDNIVNYGGQRWIPYKNPVNNISIYY